MSDAKLTPQLNVSLKRKREKLILIQPLTSDPKKNWGLPRFLHLKKTLESAFPDFKVRILAADFEKELLSKIFAEADIWVTSISEARQILAEASLLITGDTSIKHLAAQVETPIVELVLGSSDYVKTRAFTKFSFAVKTTAACAPCKHSDKCSQKSHICAEMMSVEEVFAGVWDILENKAFSQPYSFDEILVRHIWACYLNQNFDSNLNLTLPSEADLEVWYKKLVVISFGFKSLIML